MNTVVTCLRGTDALTALELQNTVTGEVSVLPAEGLFQAVGQQPEGTLARALGIADRDGFIAAGENCRTSVPGIFAAGDVRSKLCRQVITAAGDGATAAQAAFVFLEQLHA